MYLICILRRADKVGDYLVVLMFVKLCRLRRLGEVVEEEVVLCCVVMMEEWFKWQCLVGQLFAAEGSEGSLMIAAKPPVFA